MLEGHRIVSVGEILVEFVSHATGCGLERIGPYSGPYPSGAPAIFVDQAARMGARADMIGGVGDDGFGRATLERLRADGVGVRGVTSVAGRPTGVAFVSYYPDGARDFIFHLGGSAADGFGFSARMLPPGPLALHVSASSLGNPALRRAVLNAARAVMDADGRITCDPNARPELLRDDDARAALDWIVARCHCLLPSTSDLGYLFPDLDEAAAVERLLASGTRIVALKRGAGGATIVGEGARHDIPGHHVTEVDPTGAGDCFGGTFVALLTRGATLAEAGRMANAAGAIAVTRRGPMEGNSGPAEIAAFLNHDRTPMEDAT